MYSGNFLTNLVKNIISSKINISVNSKNRGLNQFNFDNLYNFYM
jgi:hypothetical protein